MSLTNITAEFLRKAVACKDGKEGVEWYDSHPTVHDWPWEVVCAALEEDGREAWSMWLRLAVARLGSAEDRATLRNDTHWLVRSAVAEYGSAEDRTALRDDPDAWVRESAEYYGRSDPK